MYVLTDIHGKDKEILTQMHNCEIKFLKKLEHNTTMITGYGTKLVIINWAEEPIAIMIKEKEIKSAFRNYFDILWKVAKS
jgi:hypothetical protein